jgi:hypothetical protein
MPAGRISRKSGRVRARTDRWDVSLAIHSAATPASSPRNSAVRRAGSTVSKVAIISAANTDLKS